MAQQWHTEGREYMLKVAFSEEESVPAAFYVGLATDAAPGEDTSVADLTELSDSGYARQTVDSNDTDCVVTTTGTNDKKVTMATVTFSNSSGGAWTAANIAFLTDKSDDSGLLIASVPIPDAPLAIGDGSSVSVPFQLQLNSP